MQPTVSIIVPCYNEEATIGSLLGAIFEQTYPHDKMEVIIADGLSTDGTRSRIAEFQRNRPRPIIRVVDNATRSIPAGLNAAIRNSSGEVIIRLDAHSIPFRDYVERCVQHLESGRVASVGGVWRIRPGAATWIAKGIALAAAHPLGAGDARYRLGGRARAVDTVPFGAFKRSLIESVGAFDESLLTNEDYELNVRIRKGGGVVWMDPEIQSAYFARATLGDLSRQYARYGFWKLRMLLRYPDTVRWRQALPACFVGALAVLPAVALFWQPAIRLLVILLAAYALALIGAGLQTAFREHEARILPAFIMALATMHVSWGLGFWASLFRSLRVRNG